jgi:glutamate-ammonia-ligase adenylyltransferase
VQLLAQLQTYRTFVAAQFDAMFGQGDEPDSSSYQPIDDGQTEEEQFASLTDKLKTLGYPDATTSARRLAALWKAHRIRSLSDSNRARLATLVNQSLPLIASTCANPGDTLGRLLDFFDAIARRSSYLSLLTAYPGTIERLLRVMSASGWAAQYLSRHPILLDELLDARTLFSAPDWSAFTTELSNRLCQERGDVERQMDVLREMHHAMLFRLLAQDLEGMLSVERLADELSKLADTVVALTVQEAWLALSGRHADSPRFAVIAYGKLGGKELGYASDLDLVFLFDDDDERAPMLYARLVQRLTTWLSSPTSAGQLFEVDTALRPDGASGLPVTRLPAFEKYQMTSAWAWEHQALTRARFCAGDAAIGAGFEAIRSKVLRQTRDAAALRRDVLSMRKKMHDAHPNHSALFDVKHDSGGMIDIEFIVQYLVLAHAAVHPGLTDNIGNIALLAYCEQIGLIPEGEGKAVSDTYRYFRRLQHQLRMQGAPVSRVEREAVAEEIARVTSLWSFVFADDQGAGAAR